MLNIETLIHIIEPRPKSIGNVSQLCAMCQTMPNCIRVTSSVVQPMSKNENISTVSRKRWKHVLAVTMTATCQTPPDSEWWSCPCFIVTLGLRAFIRIFHCMWQLRVNILYLQWTPKNIVAPRRETNMKYRTYVD